MPAVTPERKKAAAPMSLVMRDFLRTSGLSRRMKQGYLADAWEAAVGAKMSALTRISDFRQNMLHVEVASAALMQELAGFRKKEILQKLRQQPREAPIHDIKFTMGIF